MKMEQIQNDLSLKRKIFILMKDIVKFLIVETNPIRKVTLLKTYIERNEQIFCFKNTNVISLINSILIWKIFLALRYLIFSLVKTSVEFKLLWFDVITLFTALKNINAFAFLIELCSIYLFKRFYYEYHEELFNIIKKVIFSKENRSVFFIEKTYKTSPIREWVERQCNAFLSQIIGLIVLLGNLVNIFLVCLYCKQRIFRLF